MKQKLSLVYILLIFLLVISCGNHNEADPQEIAQKALMNNPATLFVNVSVKEGEATISGEVKDNEAKYLAYKLVLVGNIKSVKNNVNVNPNLNLDKILQNFANHKLSRVMATSRVNVEVLNDIATLTGEVEDENAKTTAIQLAKVDGVKFVTDKIFINSNLNIDEETKKNLISKFQKEPELALINIDVKDGICTLEGKVADEISRKKASSLAMINNAVKIDNKIEIIWKNEVDKIDVLSKDGKYIFEPSKQMTLDKPEIVVFVLGTDENSNDFEKKIVEIVKASKSTSTEQNSGSINKLKDSIKPTKVAPEMQAILEGEGKFKIEQIGESRLSISEKTTSEWKWKVTPLETGELNLTLKLNAHINLNDGQEKHIKRQETIEKKIKVETPYFGYTIVKALDDWKYVLATIISLFSAYYGYLQVKNGKRNKI